MCKRLIRHEAKALLEMNGLRMLMVKLLLICHKMSCLEL